MMDKINKLGILFGSLLLALGIYDIVIYFFGTAPSTYSLGAFNNFDIFSWLVVIAGLVLIVLSVYFLVQRYRRGLRGLIVFVSWYYLLYSVIWSFLGTIIFGMIYGSEIGVTNAIALAARFDIVFFILHIVFGVYLLFMLLKKS